jgi:archaemetzincin
MKCLQATLFVALLFLLNACASKSQSELEVIEAFAIQKHKAQEGDWLNEHKENRQTLNDYINAEPNKMTPQRNKLHTALIGPLDKQDYECYLMCKEYLHLMYRIELDTIENISIAALQNGHTRKNTFGLQLHSEYILDSILRNKLPKDAYGLVAFTAYDLYPEPSWNFVFGQANLKARVGVWSMARHKETDSTGRINYLLSDKRTLATAVHEVGHMFGIKHCVPYECVMNGSNSLYESDGQVIWMCHECVSKLNWIKPIDYKSYYKQLNSFWQQHPNLDTFAVKYFSTIDSLLSNNAH